MEDNTHIRKADRVRNSDHRREPSVDCSNSQITPGCCPGTEPPSRPRQVFRTWLRQPQGKTHGMGDNPRIHPPRWLRIRSRENQDRMGPNRPPVAVSYKTLYPCKGYGLSSKENQMRSERIVLSVMIDLDTFPGAFHTPEQARETVESILLDRLGHYHPIVLLKDNTQ